MRVGPRDPGPDRQSQPRSVDEPLPAPAPPRARKCPGCSHPGERGPRRVGGSAILRTAHCEDEASRKGQLERNWENEPRSRQKTRKPSAPMTSSLSSASGDLLRSERRPMKRTKSSLLAFKLREVRHHPPAACCGALRPPCAQSARVACERHRWQLPISFADAMAGRACAVPRLTRSRGCDRAGHRAEPPGRAARVPHTEATLCGRHRLGGLLLLRLLHGEVETARLPGFAPAAAAEANSARALRAACSTVRLGAGSHPWCVCTLAHTYAVRGSHSSVQ